MRIARLISSLVDYPGHICSTIFTIGCNLRCSFCYNHLLFEESKPKEMSGDYVLQILESRKSFTKYICITGGEPSIQNDLDLFIKKLYNKGFKIKLDTNGLNPDMIEKCIPYLDYIAMDIKTSPELYVLLEPKVKWKLRQFYESDKIQKSKYYRNKILESIKLIMNSGIDYEFRTTVVPGLVTQRNIRKIAKLVKGCKKYILQQYYPNQAYKKKLYPISYDKKTLIKFKDILKKYCQEVIIKV